MRGKLVGIARGAGGVAAAAAVKPEMLALTKNAWMLGSNFDINKEYKHPTLGAVKVVGYKASARKFPIIIKQVRTGKEYKTTMMSVKSIIV